MFFRLICFILISIPLTGCVARKNLPIGEVPPLIIPDKAVVAQTKQSIEGSFAKEGKVLPMTAPQTRRVVRVITRLKASAGGQQINYPIYVIDAGPKQINAMVVNGSAVLVFKELVDRLKSDDQLAAILAHELGHVSGRHAEDKGEETRSGWVSLGSTILGVAASVAVAYGGGSSASINNAGQLAETVGKGLGDGAVVKAYSRSMEYEADQIGLVLMARAGYNPEAAIEVWKNAEELFDSSGGLSFWSTHPSSDDRYQKLEAMLPIAKKEFKVRTPAELEQDELAIQKIEKEGIDLKEAEKILKEAHLQIGQGDTKSAVKGYKKYISLVSKNSPNDPQIEDLKSTIEIIEWQAKGLKTETVTAEEKAMLGRIKSYYLSSGLKEDQVNQTLQSLSTVTEQYPASARLRTYKRTLERLVAQ